MEIGKNKGLYNRYQIAKTSGRPIDPKAKYFVMRYDNDGDDKIHIQACQLAIRVYAYAIKGHLDQLSENLLNLEEIKKS